MMLRLPKKKKEQQNKIEMLV